MNSTVSGAFDQLMSPICTLAGVSHPFLLKTMCTGALGVAFCVSRKCSKLFHVHVAGMEFMASMFGCRQECDKGCA